MNVGFDLCAIPQRLSGVCHIDNYWTTVQTSGGREPVHWDTNRLQVTRLPLEVQDNRGNLKALMTSVIGQAAIRQKRHNK